MKDGRNGKISFNKYTNWLDKELKQTRTKRVIDLYSKMLLNGTIDYDKLGRVYRQDQKEPGWTVQRLLKQKEVKAMIDAKLDEALLGEGVDYKYLITKRKSIIDLAETNNKLDIALKGIEGFENMKDMYRVNKEVKQISQSVSYKQLLENGSKNEITATQTETLPTIEPEEEEEKPKK